MTKIHHGQNLECWSDLSQLRFKTQDCNRDKFEAHGVRPTHINALSMRLDFLQCRYFPMAFLFY